MSRFVIALLASGHSGFRRRSPLMFVQALLQEQSMENLLEYDDKMVHEVKNLDTDMQMLVYENYNKFISATDTIRSMKVNVQNMESEMDTLVRNMATIRESSADINDKLAAKREKVSDECHLKYRLTPCACSLRLISWWESAVY
jgi:hypothetical protein